MLFKKKGSDQEKPASVTLDEFLISLRGVQGEIRERISARLRELEFDDVDEMSRKSLQFYQREIGNDAAEVIAGVLADTYHVNLKDLRVMKRSPGSPGAIDENYCVPSFY